MQQRSTLRLSPPYQDVLADLYAQAHPLSGLASGVRPQHTQHGQLLKERLSVMLSAQAALGNHYFIAAAGKLRSHLAASLSESALSHPCKEDYNRLVDNALHNLPAGYQVRYTSHRTLPHNSMLAKAFIFKLEAPPEGGAEADVNRPSGTTGSTSHQRLRSR